MHPAVAVILSYVSGSIPAAWLAGKWSGVDLRAHGSGNLGATNVVRVLGAKIGLLVFAVDIAKGALPVRFLPRYTDPAVIGGGVHAYTVIAIACGIAAIVGHIRPVFLGFQKGGKGVATACGVFLALAPIQALLSLLIFVVVLLASGYVSLGSLTAAFSLPVLVAASLGVASPIFAVAALTAVFVFWTHRANIQRLRSGSEYRFGKAANFGRRPSLAIGIALLVLAAAFLSARYAGGGAR
ncbi:MAG TPA: glycerol-3-phosphate 1-O-acyltransferase PlsY [Gemmatimonadaceae bacterium]|nr:glycerol-3-phosphate 1-O-acyltransferase PlsY [Gemmatimonadaceae bacterium]